jgi:hypothetical protein
MKVKSLVFALVVCMAATPAMAELFGFSVHDPMSAWDGASAYDVSWGSVTELTLSRQVAPIDNVHLLSSTPTLGDFAMSLTISNIGVATADAIGSFTITDIDATADTITGDIAGAWLRVGSSNVLIGTLSNVNFNDNGTADGFDGDDGELSMSFWPDLPPWTGTLTQLVVAPWFGQSSWSAENGSVDATVVPVPAAVILGVLGLAVAGWKLRRFA